MGVTWESTGSTSTRMPLVTVVRSLDTNKIIRQTQILLKIFLCFDVFFIVSFLVQLVWLSSIYLGGFREGKYVLNFQFLTTPKFVHGYCFIGFFTASLICNILALVGVRRWNQWYVLPWLAVYTAFKIFLRHDVTVSSLGVLHVEDLNGGADRQGEQQGENKDLHVGRRLTGEPNSVDVSPGF